MDANSAFAASVHTAAITVAAFTAMVILSAAWFRDMPGLRWWAVANILLALTLQLYVPRADDWFGGDSQSLSLVFVTTWITGFLLTCAPLFVLAGIEETIGVRKYLRALGTVAVLQVISHTYFTFAEPSAVHRTIGLTLYFGFASAFCAFVLLRSAPRELRVTAGMAAAALLLVSLRYAHRLGALWTELMADRLESPVVAGQGTFTTYAAVNILWTFSLIIMAEHKRRLTHARQAEADRKAENDRREQRIREEISRDLHDTLSGTVATISLLSARQDGADYRAAVEKIHTLAQNARNDVRMLLNQLSSPHSSERKWVVECRNMAESITEPCGLELDWRAEGCSDRIIGEPAAALGLIRAIREILNNVVRHAAASRVQMRFVCRAAQLEVSVRDNGKGIVCGDGPGFGLGNIRSRVSELGGTISIENNEGTWVRISVPLPLAPRKMSAAVAST